MGNWTKKEVLDEQCLLPRTAKASNPRLEFHVGWSGWTRPGKRGGLQGREEGFLEGSKRPEAG